MTWATYWGQSELSQLGVIGYFRDPSEIPEGDSRWIGRPTPHVEVRVVDEGGADSEVGELLCRSPGVMEGYYRNPRATAAVLRGGWLHTGDVVRLDSGWQPVLPRPAQGHDQDGRNERLLGRG